MLIDDAKERTKLLVQSAFFFQKYESHQGALKKTREAPCRKFASSGDLPTYLPEHRESRTQRRRGGRGGSPISRPVLFLLRTCTDVRFSVKNSPQARWRFRSEKFPRASARTTPVRCAHAATPAKCHKTASFGCRWPQNRGAPKNFGNIFAGAGLPTYPACGFLSFF